MRAGRLGKRLAVAVPTAAVTVATGVAINGAFVTGHGFIWPWVWAAAGLALVQVLLLGREAKPVVEDGQVVGSPAAGQNAWGGRERRAAIAARLRDESVTNARFPEMPVAWMAVSEARDPGHGMLRVSGADEVTEFLLDSERRRMVIIGQPGSGKTSLAWRMVSDMTVRDDLAWLFPVVVPVGTWNPFEQGFDDWLQGYLPDIPGIPEPGLQVSEVLPVLDGLDEYSSQVRGQALGILSNRYHCDRPLVLLSRPDPYQPTTRWGDAIGAATVELMPLPPAEIVRYLKSLPRGSFSAGLDSAAAEVSSNPAGTVGTALSSPFMLDTFARTHQFLPGFLGEAESRDAIWFEDLLAARFMQMQIMASRRWGTGNPEKWLAAVAARARSPFAFRPNHLEIPVPVTTSMLTAAAALPAVAMLVSLRQLPALLTVLLLLLLGGGYWIGLTIVSEYTGNGPILDPRSELRIERGKAAGKAAAAAGITVVLGFLDVAAPYTGRWTLALGAVTGALLFLPWEGSVRQRFLSSAAGALPGLALGWAAYSGTQFVSFWRFAVPAVIIGGLVFFALFIVGIAGHVFNGRGREDTVSLLSEAASFALPIGLLAGSVSAVSALSQLGLAVSLLNKITGLVIFTGATAGALLLTTVWTSTWASYAYFAARGTFPLRLLAFLEDFSERQVLRRVGYSYEFKHPALLRAARSTQAESEAGWQP